MDWDGGELILIIFGGCKMLMRWDKAVALGLLICLSLIVGIRTLIESFTVEPTMQMVQHNI